MLFTGIQLIAGVIFNIADDHYKEIYYMALLEAMKEYNAQKRTAHAMKTVKHGTGADISTVDPEQYSRRFLDFVMKIIE